MYLVECICNRACLIMIMNSTIQTQLIVRVTRENNITQTNVNCITHHYDITLFVN